MGWAGLGWAGLDANSVGWLDWVKNVDGCQSPTEVTDYTAYVEIF